jgi:hypothetical protein
MAKEKTGGTVLLRGQVTQAAPNGFVQANLLTGLSTSGNDALIIKQITLEFPTFVNGAVGIFEVESALCRASKVAMPTISDDDVLYKRKLSYYLAAAQSFEQQGVAIFVPEYEIVVIEDVIYFDFKTLNCAAAGTAFINVIAQPATVTESEKVGILLTRLN